jgi:hypothetical protein
MVIDWNGHPYRRRGYTMKQTYDEYGRVHYELPTLDTTEKGLAQAAKKMKRQLTRPRMVREA